MEKEGRTTAANRSERTIVKDPERTAVSPRFDQKSIQRARPAVPLEDRAGGRRRLSRFTVLVLAVGLFGVVAGAVGAYFYGRAGEATDARASDDAATQRPADGAGADGAKADGAAPPAAPAVVEDELFRPTADDLPDVAPPPAEEAPRAPEEVAGGSAPDEGTQPGEQAALRSALGEWVGATNARDIRRQMQFYDSRLDAYYLSRGTPAAAVRAEKERVFGRARSIDVRASDPAIRFGPDGRTATMRFRKSYHIGGGGQDSRGEVVQELRWRKTPQGWKIVSERDVRVLN